MKKFRLFPLAPTAKLTLFAVALVASVGLVVAGLSVPLTLNAQVPGTFAIIGLVSGYIAWRRRSARPVVWITVTWVTPALVLLLLLGAVPTPAVALALSLTFLPATVLGNILGALADRVSERVTPKQIRAAWGGIDSVTGGAGATAVTFDIRPLLVPLLRHEIREATQHVPADTLTPKFAVFRAMYVTGMPIVVLLIVMAFRDPDYVSGSDATSQILSMTAVFSLLLLGYIIIGVLGVRGMRQRTTAAEHLSLARFASANGFEYRPGPLAPQGRGALTRVLRSPSGWTLANEARPGTQAPDSIAPVTQFSGFSEFPLETALPHLLLIRRRLRWPTFGAQNTPSPEQRLKLEGDFNRYFDTYCPVGYERDALYILTPDVMAALIDGARHFDVEIIDDRLILRSRKDLVTIDPAVWQTIARAVGEIAGSSRQWKLWRDDRRAFENHSAHVDDPSPTEGAELTETAPPRLLTTRPAGAAKAGRRLKGSLSLGLALILGYAAIYVGLVLVANSL